MTRLHTNNPDWRADPRNASATGAIQVMAFLTDRWRWAVGAALGLLALVAVVAGYVSWSGRKDTAAATLLQKAASRLESVAPNGSDDAKQAEGIRLLRDVVQQYPSSAAAAEATLRLGTYYYTLGKYAEARSAYTVYLEKSPRGAIAFSAALGVGDTYLAERNYEKATETYSRLIEQFAQEPLLPEAQLHLATALRALHREQEAGVLLEKIVATYPNSGWAQRAQSELYRSAFAPR